MEEVINFRPEGYVSCNLSCSMLLNIAEWMSIIIARGMLYCIYNHIFNILIHDQRNL